MRILLLALCLYFGFILIMLIDWYFAPYRDDLD